MPDLPEVYSVHVDAGDGAHKRACLEAALPDHLRETYPGWMIWEAAGRWHAHRRGNFQQSLEPGAPRYAVHAGGPAALWAALIIEMDKNAILPMVPHAGEGHHGKEAPSRPARVHAPVRGRDGASASRHLRLT